MGVWVKCRSVNRAEAGSGFFYPYKVVVWIPGNLAYDNSPRPDAPKGMLVFDVELLAIK
jgi:hypothetical protein